jgi:hypothetical protein
MVRYPFVSTGNNFIPSLFRLNPSFYQFFESGKYNFFGGKFIYFKVEN